MTENIKDFKKCVYLCEPFYYGNRLKGEIGIAEKEKTITYRLYTHNKKIVDSGMWFFTDNKNRLEKYRMILNIVRDYLNNCKY